jgi:hypothetical protein
MFNAALPLKRIGGIGCPPYARADEELQGSSTVSMRGVAVRNVGYFAALNITLGSLPSGDLPALLDKYDTIIK